MWVARKTKADREKRRQLWRNQKHAKTDTRKLQQARQIYKNIKHTLDSSAGQVTPNFDRAVSPE